MRSPCFVLAGLLVGASALATDPPAPSDTPLFTGFPNIPADARRVAERLAACTHFAGEINGDNGERDKEVGTRMSELHCDSIDKDAAAIRRKYAADPDVNKALDQAENP